MADISAEISAFKNAIYGEDVRDSMVSLANKLNDLVSSSDLGKILAQQIYFATSDGKFYTKTRIFDGDSYASLLIRWTGNITHRNIENHGYIFPINMNVSVTNMLYYVSNSYRYEDEDGLIWIRIPDANVLVYDGVDKIFAIVSNSVVDGIRYIPMIGNNNGNIVHGFYSPLILTSLVQNGGVPSEVGNLKSAFTHSLIDSINLEVGGFNTTTGAETDNNKRARTGFIHAPAYIYVNSGYIITGICAYTVTENGLTFDGYTSYGYRNLAFVDETKLYRLIIAKNDSTQVISDLSAIVSAFVQLNSHQLVLTGMGTSGSAAGATNVGDIFFNTNNKMLRMLVKHTTYDIFDTIPYHNDAIYICSGDIYKWNGTDLVILNETSSDSLQEYKNEINTTINILDYNIRKDVVLLQLQSGGINLDGIDDNGDPTHRLRSRYISLSEKSRLVLSDAFEARVFTYNKLTGAFVNMSSYGNSFNILDTDTYVIRILIRRKNQSAISPSDISTNNCVLTISKTYVPLSHFEPVIGSPHLYLSDTYEKTSIDDKTTTNLFNAYDELVTNHPKYFRRASDIGVDADENNIRQYILGYTESRVFYGEGGTTNLWSEDYYYNKILVTSGVHGDEKTASWGLMLAIKEILESTDEWAKFIRSNFIIKVIPCVNIWGFDNMTRNNKDGVNVNRDANAWESLEGQAIKSFIDTNTDAIFYLDVHGTSGSRAYTEIWKYSPYLFAHCKLTAQTDASLYDNWKAQNWYASFPAIISTYNNLLISYAENQYNIPAFIVETPRDNVTGTSVNYLSACKMAKDTAINILQAVGAHPYIQR